MSAYTFTLSRAHAIADRLRKAADAKSEEAQNTLSGVALTAELTAEQRDVFRARGERARVQVEEARQGYTLVAHIRAAVAEANAKHGISRLLAETEAKRAEVRVLSVLVNLGNEALTAATLDTLTDALKARPTDSQGRVLGSVRISLLGLSQFEPYRETRTVLQAQINALSDQVNDLNKNTITVELPENLAKEVGL